MNPRASRGLRGELSAGPGVGEDGGVDGSDVVVDGVGGESVGEDAPPERDLLAGDDDVGSGEVGSEVEASGPGEEGDGADSGSLGHTL